MRNPLASRDPLTLLLNGDQPPYVPVAPVYEGLGPLQFHRMALQWKKWWDRLEKAGTDRLEVGYQARFEVELEIETEILDRFYPPPTWLGLPWSPGRVEAAVVRRGKDLFWVSGKGEAWMPPNREAYYQSLTAQGSQSPYSNLWERKSDAEGLLRQAAAKPASVSSPTPGEVEAEMESVRYDLPKALMRRYSENLPFYSDGCSPYNGLFGAFGFQEMMCAFAESPDLVHQVLESRRPCIEARLLAQRQLGITLIFVEECLSSADLISPKTYLEFCFPYTKQALEFYENLGFRTVLYFAGNLMPLLPYLRELPFTALSFEEDRKGYGIDLAEVRRAMGPARILFGNIDALFVEKASDEELLAEVRRQIEVAGRDGNFVVSIGSPFTPGTSLERVRFFCDSTKLL